MMILMNYNYLEKNLEIAIGAEVKILLDNAYSTAQKLIRENMGQTR